MSIFIDTPAFIAVLNADDAHHPKAQDLWNSLLASGEPLITSNYVLLETISVAQRRLGMGAVRAFYADGSPVLDVVWVTESVHEAAEVSLLVAGRRDLSLVDCTSFELMRRRGLTRAFTFDPHFADQGFECLPGSKE